MHSTYFKKLYKGLSAPSCWKKLQLIALRMRFLIWTSFCFPLIVSTLSQDGHRRYGSNSPLHPRVLLKRACIVARDCPPLNDITYACCPDDSGCCPVGVTCIPNSDYCDDPCRNGDVPCGFGCCYKGLICHLGECVSPVTVGNLLTPGMVITLLTRQ